MPLSALPSKDVWGFPVPEQDYSADYSISDLELVLGERNWKSWTDAIRWLDEQGRETAEVPAEARQAMRDDFEQLNRDQVPFTLDAARVYELTHVARSRHR